MTRRVSVTVSLCLLLATSAWAQLASQTALVGTVTDSGGLVIPGALVMAVNTGTKDTYEATTNAEGYYNIPFVRPGRYDVTVSLSGFQTVKASGVEVSSNQVVRTNAVMPVGGVTESVNVSARCAGARHRSRDGVGDDRHARDRRAAAERPQRLEPGEHDARCARRPQQRHRPQLPRRRPARDSEQPVARRHQLLVQPARGDEHAADRRRGDRDSGADRQHVRRVRLVSRRAHQRGDQERHQHRPRGAVRVLSGRCARFARATSRTPRTRRIRATANSSAGRWTAPS